MNWTCCLGLVAVAGLAVAQMAFGDTGGKETAAAKVATTPSGLKYEDLKEGTGGDGQGGRQGRRSTTPAG